MRPAPRISARSLDSAIPARQRPGARMTSNTPPPDELRALLQRLTHVSRLATMGEMAAGIAHELNQPLTAIASYAQACDWLLSRGSTDTAEIRDALQQIT